MEYNIIITFTINDNNRYKSNRIPLRFHFQIFKKIFPHSTHTSISVRQTGSATGRPINVNRIIYSL